MLFASKKQHSISLFEELFLDGVPQRFVDHTFVADQGVNVKREHVLAEVQTAGSCVVVADGEDWTGEVQSGEVPGSVSGLGDDHNQIDFGHLSRGVKTGR